VAAVRRCDRVLVSRSVTRFYNLLSMSLVQFFYSSLLPFRSYGRPPRRHAFTRLVDPKEFRELTARSSDILPQGCAGKQSRDCLPIPRKPMTLACAIIDASRIGFFSTSRRQFLGLRKSVYYVLNLQAEVLIIKFLHYIKIFYVN